MIRDIHWCISWQPLLFSHGLKIMALDLARTIFEQDSELKSLELKGIVVIFHQFSKSKRILFQERSIFHFPRLGFWKLVNCSGNRPPYIKFRCYVIFKIKGIGFILRKTSSFYVQIKDEPFLFKSPLLGF